MRSKGAACACSISQLRKQTPFRRRVQDGLETEKSPKKKRAGEAQVLFELTCFN